MNKNAVIGGTIYLNIHEIKKRYSRQLICRKTRQYRIGQNYPTEIETWSMWQGPSQQTHTKPELAARRSSNQI